VPLPPGFLELIGVRSIEARDPPLGEAMH